MNQITKRTLSFFVAFVMLFSLMPSMALATETGNGSTKPNYESVEDFINSSYGPGEATYKGMNVVEKGPVLKYSSAESTGEETGLYYVIAETSEGRTVLGVGGSGEIPKCDYKNDTYYSYKKMPWAKYDAAHQDNPIKDIYIENGVTRAYAFSFFYSKAETLSIADSVYQIDNAFQRCYNLKEIYVPITTCINSSFALCADDGSASNTREIIYVDTGKDASVAKHTFGDKSGITKVTFPASVTTITDNYFSDAAAQYSSLTELKFEDGNNVIAMTVSAGKLDNITDITGLSEISKATLLGSESLKNSSWYTNNADTTTTENGFKVINGIQLVEYTGSDENVTIPDGIEVIGPCAFFGKEIKSVTIPKSVQFISERAFLCCRNLESVTFEGADDGTSTLKTIGKLAFAGTAIKEITLPASLETIEEAAFVNVGEGFAKTEEYSITNGAAGEAVAVLEKVHIVDTEENPSKLKTIGKFAFNSCRNLTEINIPDSVQSFARGSFRRCMTLKEINLPEGMKEIPGFCFVFCEKLTSVTIPESVESIGDWAFEGCSGLTEVRIPANVKTLGSGAFEQQYSIKAFYIDSPSFEFFDGTESGKSRTFLGASDCKMYVRNQEVKNALLSKKIFIKNADNIIVYPAVIGAKGYPTLAEAVNAAKSGDVLTIIGMPKNGTKLTIAEGVTVNTYGSVENHTIVMTKGGFVDAVGLTANAGYTLDGAAGAKDTTVFVDPEKGHSYIVTYTWSADYLTCSAEMTCATENCTEKATDSATVTAAVTKPATSTSKGITTYTATFTIPGFSTQTQEVETMPSNVPSGITIVDSKENEFDGQKVDGTSGKSLVIECIDSEQEFANKETIENEAKNFAKNHELQVLDTAQVNLYVLDGSTLKSVSEVELSGNITVLLPYDKAAEGMMLLHWNGTGFDGPIPTTLRVIDSVSYLEFQYNKFSPFVIVGGVGYNAITATTGEGYTVTYSGMGKTGEDYTFTVTVDSGYTLQSVKANGKAFTLGGATYEKVNDSTYTIKNLNDNYKIEVKVTKEAYTVTYLVNGEYYAEKTGIAHNGTVPYKPASPKVDGYTFDGWYKTWTDNGDGVVEATELADEFTFGTGGTQVTADTTLYAKLTEIGKVTVTFADGDTSQLITVPDNVIVDEGSSFVISNFVPERAGYIFKGWKDSTDVYAPGATYTVGTTAVTLTAQWVADQVTVTAGTVGAGATLSTLTSPVTRGTEVAFTVTVTDGYDPAALVVKANDVALAYSAVNGNVYHYSFVANADTTITVSDLAELSYTVTMPVGDNFTAEFTPVTDPATTSKTVTHGEGYSFVVTPDAGYNIKGVYVNGVKQTADPNGVYIITNVTGPQTIEVSVDEIPVYTVTYVVNNAQYTTQKVSEGAKITTLPAAPVVDGYTFYGWATTNGKTEDSDVDVTADTVVSADMTVYAVLKAKTYTVTYDGNGSDGGTVLGAQTKIHGVALNLSTAVPTRTGYKFLGWGTTADATVVSYQPGQTYSADVNLKLYAVWEQLTFTVTLPSGTGFTVNALGSTTVKYGADFKFEVIVDRAYAKTAPVVEVNGNPLNGTGATSDSTSATWTYTITGVKEDKQVAISVTMNPTHVVTFKTWLTDVDPTAANTTLYMTQKVENGYPAAQPAAPVVEGYIFGGWVWDDPATADTTLVDYSFATLVNTPVTIVAKMLPIVPVVTWTDVTDPEDGWDITVDDADVTLVGDSDPDDGTNKVKYGSDMTFTVTIGEGWDASKMAVGANGLALAPVSIKEQPNKTVVYTYNLVNITADTAITVVGVVRKTVTITYNANARDDVSDMPVQQVVKYYLASDNSKIINQIPVRTGYTFLGWCTKSDYDGTSTLGSSDKFYAKGVIEAQDGDAVSTFTSDTTLYAIWDADSTTITLDVSDVAVDAAAPANAKEYEGQPVTLTAKLSTAVSTGSINFYQNGKLLKSVDANGTATYTTTATTSPYKLDGTAADVYTVEYKSEGDEGYGNATLPTTEAKTVKVLSTAITWQTQVYNNGSDHTVVTFVDASGTITMTGDKLAIYAGTSATGTPVNSMVANTVYTLKTPTVYGLNGETLTAGTDYTVQWEYKDAAGQQRTYSADENKDTVTINAEYSQYQFRAIVTPVKDAALSVFAKAAGYSKLENKYDELNNDKAPALYTQFTPAVEKQETNTTLAITGADNEDADVKINGATPFSAAHLAQFEGQTVTLTATVKETSTGAPAVASGSVEFYQNGTLIATVPVETAGTNMGKASCTATMKAFSGTATTAKDTFYAKYVENATYDESTSTTSDVYIKSTKIQTPVITSAEAGTGNATSTTYDADLTGLLAGVEHTFTLKTTGATTAESANWSVVALDGRTVASTDYTIKWLATTGDNEEATVANGSSYTTSDNKVGDMFRVELVPTGDMKTGATSKYAKIGTKQDVNVTVTAEDKITSTPEIDVYQLNEIKLTATVAAAEGANATVKPSGTVAFYYKDGTNWVYLDEAVLTKDTDGQMRASITTDKLPVTGGTNVKRDVEITAVYLGDETFKVSGNYNETTEAVSAGTTTNGVTDATVTVYSSVVYVNSGVENVASNTVGQNHNSGIYIYAEEDKVLANETNVNLMLSDVYTLDHDIPLSKLTDGTEADYTVQWQKLTNAQVEEYRNNYAAAPWQNIEGKTGTICQITVEQGAAYRAVITVKDTPIAKGSYNKVVQTIAGRQVYYSNILVAADAPATVTVNVNTDNTTDGYEGIVEGETVTIHTFASGASGTTPISELTVTVTATDVKDVAAGTVVDEQVKTNVNGHVSFDWTAAKPGYYTLKVVAKFTNGYSDKEITRTLIVRDNAYDFTAAGDNTTYNGKVQGLTVTVNNMGIENDLAQKSVVVYYYDKDGKQVEPTQAGTYKAVIRLQESAYWTEKTMDTTFTIKQREVSVVDLIAQAKVYDGTTNVNIQEIILNDAVTDQTTTGLPTDNTGIINGDSVYAVGTGYTSSENAGTVTLNVKDVTLKGDDAANYNLADATYTEAFNIQRSQVKGDIADSTFKYTGSNITVPADDIILIDQAGNVITSANYTVTYYYHNGDGVEKVTAMNKLGKYTVIARPEQTNYKGGASETIYVVSGNGTDEDPTKPTSLTIDITDTVVLYTGTQVGVTAKDSKGNTITDITYNGSTAIPTAAGRYLVKVTASTGDTAYGIYTIVKANPTLTLTAANQEYNSAQYDGTPTGSYNGDDTGAVNGFPAGTYFTYAGGTIQGVAYEAPTEVGTYIVTAHVPETENYTAHEISYQFVITPKALTITADSLQRRQYGAFPDMTASFDGLATGGVAVDTSLRDVQIQPELIFNAAYSNDAMDQVGSYTITPVAALARNYVVKVEDYVPGIMTVTADEPNPYLAIHGMIDNGNGGDIAYYGDVIQLYAYGSQSETTGVINNSSVLTWSVTNPSIFGTASISEDGLLTINGVGTFTVTLERGVGAQKISTTLTITALKKEVKVNVPDEDKVYDATTQTYTVGNMKAYDEKFNDVTATITSGNINRENVGSQIVTGKVADSIQSFQSETYGGQFTINDKEATVAPGAQETVYGTKETYDDVTYVVTGKAGSVDPITDVMVASVADAYANLDVLDGYEILVAGVENKNYNVKYITDVTDGSTPDAQVTAKPLTFKTGVIDSDGRTSGYMEDNDQFYKDEGYAITGTTFNANPNDRMYGEVNPVMDYLFTGLVGSDNEADLKDILDWLVEYSAGANKHNIKADANVKFNNSHLSVSGHRADPTANASYISNDANDVYVIDGMLTTGGVKNYTTTVTEATQNIYQRPVTLTVRPDVTLTAYKPSIIDDSNNVKQDVLKQLLLNNLVVGEYNGKGGLATLLGHTIEDLEIGFAATPTYNAATGEISVTIKLGNTNYWTENVNFTVKVDPTKIVATYGPLGWTRATVTMIGVDGNGNTTGPVDVSGTVTYLIYAKDTTVTEHKYSHYKNLTPVRSVTMTPGGSTGYYIANYDRLSAGDYVMFAIAEGYTIIE